MIIYKKIIIPHLFKCAGTSIRRTIVKYNHDGLEYVSEHDSAAMLESSSFSWCSDYQSATLVRHPYAFYESLYNYHKDMGTVNSLATILDKQENGDIKPFDEWLDINLDIPGFFRKNPEKISHFVKSLAGRNGFLKTWFIDKPLTQLKPEDFIGSIYALNVNKVMLTRTKTFKLETQMNEFRRLLELPSILEENKTKDKSVVLSRTQKAKIYKHDKELFERFGYEK